MSGWIALFVTLALALGAMRLLGLNGGTLTAAAAALMLGASGYSLQGRPGTPAMLAKGRADAKVMPLTSARHAFFGDFGPGESWMRMSEALASTGKTEDAVGILTNATQRSPGDPQLWVGLGNALVEHAGRITPPAEYAYRRAAEVAPGNPAGPFFYGLALARSGETQAAVAIWQSILSTAPKNASWRPLIEQGVAALGQPAKPPQEKR